jgi:hypothetical protein
MSILLASRLAGNLSFSNLGSATTSRTRLCGFTMAVAVVLLLTAPVACADTMKTFDLITNYPANLEQDGTDSGTITIDTTTGTVDAIDLSFGPEPSSDFDTYWDIAGSGSSAFVEIGEAWAPIDAFYAVYIALPVNTLVGYNGGLICSTDNPCDNAPKSYSEYGHTQVPYTDGQLTITPEPPYLALLGAGVLCLFEIFRHRSFCGSKQATTISAH